MKAVRVACSCRPVSGGDKGATGINSNQVHYWTFIENIRRKG